MASVLKRGDTVSLNLPKHPYFFQGADGINLVAGKEESMVIPEHISDEKLEVIQKSVRAQYLVVGSGAKIQVPQSDESIESDLETVLKKGRNAVKDYIYSVVDDKDKKDEEKIGLLEKLADLEKRMDNRKSVLDSIEASLDKLAGVSPVQETEAEPVQIQLS